FVQSPSILQSSHELTQIGVDSPYRLLHFTRSRPVPLAGPIQIAEVPRDDVGAFVLRGIQPRENLFDALLARNAPIILEPVGRPDPLDRRLRAGPEIRGSRAALLLDRHPDRLAAPPTLIDNGLAQGNAEARIHLRVVHRV